MFVPPRCPNSECPFHRDPPPRFYIRKGQNHPKCRPWPVPRFRCRACHKGFSRQTFRMDYRDHRPDLNSQVFLLLASGLGLRQTARIVDMTHRCTEMKFRKIARHLRGLNLNLRGPLAQNAVLQLDEFETYEGCRNTRPLTMPMLIEQDSRFVVWAEAAPIRPRGKMTPARQRRIARHEARYGVREDLSRQATRNTLARGAELTNGLQRVVLHTDEKTTYPTLAKEAFGEDRLEHRQTNSQLARGTWNPLFPINHGEAMARDLTGRLRRESWLASKQRACLDLQLQVHMAYRNYWRRRCNPDKQSPAAILGFVHRRMSATELLSWRQDWQGLSIHPLATRLESVADWRPPAP